MENSTGTLKKSSVDKKKSLVWLCSSGLKGEMENLIIATQHRALNTHFHQRNMMNHTVDSICRMCYNAEEHMRHTVGGCTTLAPPEYANRHSNVAGFNP